MSWYTDTQMVIFAYSHGSISTHRMRTYLSVGATIRDDYDDFGRTNFSCNIFYNFSKHLSIGDNKESEYDEFLSFVKAQPHYTCINSQGLMFTRVFGGACTVYRADKNSPFYSLPTLRSLRLREQQKSGLQPALDENAYSEFKTILKDQEKNWKAEVLDLQEQLKQEKNANQDLKKQNLALKLKLEEICGAADEGGPADEAMSEMLVETSKT